MGDLHEMQKQRVILSYRHKKEKIHIVLAQAVCSGIHRDFWKMNSSLTDMILVIHLC